MPLVGGGGAGNVAGSNPAGTGTSLNFIRTSEGNFAFGDSGALDASTTSQVALKFNMGSNTLVGTINFNQQCEYANAGSGVYAAKVTYDSEVIALKLLESTDHYDPSLNIIIPPYTDVTVEVKSTEDSADEKITIVLTGRVY